MEPKPITENLFSFSSCALGECPFGSDDQLLEGLNNAETQEQPILLWIQNSGKAALSGRRASFIRAGKRGGDRNDRFC